MYKLRTCSLYNNPHEGQEGYLCWQKYYWFPVFPLFCNTKFPIFPIFSILSVTGHPVGAKSSPILLRCLPICCLGRPSRLPLYTKQIMLKLCGRSCSCEDGWGGLDLTVWRAKIVPGSSSMGLWVIDSILRTSCSAVLLWLSTSERSLGSVVSIGNWRLLALQTKWSCICPSKLFNGWRNSYFLCLSRQNSSRWLSCPPSKLEPSPLRSLSPFLNEQCPVTAHAPNFDFWTGCHEIKKMWGE